MDNELINLVNKLQDAFAMVGLANTIDLPQIVVVGSQSSGKSSVLENIVGRDFLPRGSGIVTRRPLVLQLMNRPKTVIIEPKSGEIRCFSSETSPIVSAVVSENEEWGEFLHLPGKKFFDFSEICKEIVRDTDEKTGGNLGISDNPINLRIYSPHVLTLTLVDLPGITKVPVGNQPADIESQIRSMIMRYISKPNSIILAVSAANADLANSDALKTARDVDSSSTRTIGVLTKIDLMDAETNVVEILKGRVIPLKLGYVPVINRGQRDIDRRKPISQAIESERMFFENHPAYSENAKYCGSPYLSQRLNSLLLHRIKASLPEIKSRIQTQLVKCRTELSALGDSFFDDAADGSKSNYLLSVVTDFCKEFGSLLDGNSSDITTNELIGGARISYLFHEIFKTYIESVDPFDQIKDSDIRTIVCNSSGSQPSLFWGTQAFEVLARQQIKRLEEPSLRCCQLVFEELSRILATMLSRPTFKRFPDLKEKMNTTVLNFFRGAMIPTQKFVSDLISAEMCYINTCHPDFISGHRATAIVTERLNPRPKAAPTPQSTNMPGFNAGQTNSVERPNIPPRNQMAQQNLQYQSNGNIGNSAMPDYSPTVEQPGSGVFSSLFQKKTGQRTAQGILDAPPQVLRPEGKLSEKEIIEIEVIKLLLTSYFNIVKRTVKDICPKAIMMNLVQYSRDNMQRTLLSELYSKGALENVLKESDHVVKRRKELRNLLGALENADEIVKSIN